MEGMLQLTYLPTEHQLADVLTKVLSPSQHTTLLRKLGMVPSPHHSSLRGVMSYILLTQIIPEPVHDSNRLPVDFKLMRKTDPL